MKMTYCEAMDLLPDKLFELSIDLEAGTDADDAEQIERLNSPKDTISGVAALIAGAAEEAAVSGKSGVTGRKEKSCRTGFLPAKWKWNRVFAAALVLTVCIAGFACTAQRERRALRDGGAELIDDSNRYAVGKEQQAGPAAIYDKYGNWVNKEDFKDILPPDNTWEHRLIDRVDGTEERLQSPPSTITEFVTKEENGTYVTPEILFTNGAFVIFTKPDGSGWELEEGETLTMSLEQYKTDYRLGKGQYMEVMYIENGVLKLDVYPVERTLTREVTLTAENAGEYYFALRNGSSDHISLKEGTITVGAAK